MKLFLLILIEAIFITAGYGTEVQLNTPEKLALKGGPFLVVQHIDSNVVYVMPNYSEELNQFRYRIPDTIKGEVIISVDTDGGTSWYSKQRLPSEKVIKLHYPETAAVLAIQVSESVSGFIKKFGGRNVGYVVRRMKSNKMDPYFVKTLACIKGETIPKCVIEGAESGDEYSVAIIDFDSGRKWFEKRIQMEDREILTYNLWGFRSSLLTRRSKVIEIGDGDSCEDSNLPRSQPLEQKVIYMNKDGVILHESSRLNSNG